MDIHDIEKAATAKFGDVIKAVRKADREYFVACKRREPVFPDRPFMTITACIQEDRVTFYWGHYDLTADEMHSAIREAEGALNRSSGSHGRIRKIAKRPMTNIEKVTHIMTYSTYGGLAQMFVMEALHKWSHVISNASPKDVDNGFISPEAWIGVAREIHNTLQTEMLTEASSLDDEDCAESD